MVSLKVFFSALIEKVDNGNGESRSVIVKRLIMDNYENIAGYFTQAMFPIIARVNYDSLDDLSSKMKEKHVGDHTPLKLLMRMACGSKEAYCSVLIISSVILITSDKEKLTSLLHPLYGTARQSSCFRHSCRSPMRIVLFLK